MTQDNSNYNVHFELGRGRASALKVIDEFCDVGVAFKHPFLGYISLLYGDREKGIRHILSRREREIADNIDLAGQVPREVVLKLIEEILFGDAKRIGPKYQIEFDGYRAILGPPFGNQMNYWLLTGFKITWNER